MKSILTRLILVSALLGGPAASAAPATKADPYTEAVNAYVTAAGQQLAAIRGEVEAETKDATDTVRQRYADVRVELERLDKMLAELKAAAPKDFDPLKAEFERAREAMIKLLAKVRQGG